MICSKGRQTEELQEPHIDPDVSVYEDQPASYSRFQQRTLRTAAWKLRLNRSSMFHRLTHAMPFSPPRPGSLPTSLRPPAKPFEAWTKARLPSCHATDRQPPPPRVVVHDAGKLEPANLWPAIIQPTPTLHYPT